MPLRRPHGGPRNGWAWRPAVRCNRPEGIAQQIGGGYNPPWVQFLQATGRMNSTLADKQFRKLAISAGITVWVGLILLAVGVMFNLGAAGARRTPILADEPAAGGAATPVALVADAFASPTATAIPTAITP